MTNVSPTASTASWHPLHSLISWPAVIAGANDSSTGAARATVHQRLGFGNGGCLFPANY